MATDKPAAQRAWRAACPSCGAPVDFRSAASASAVCGYCRSTLARDGEALRRIGRSAELFDDHSPLQLGVTGRAQGTAFTLIGLLQFAYEGGTWNEWHVGFDDGRSAWLSEDNGAYVLGFDAPLTSPAPSVSDLRVGQRLGLNGAVWEVAARVAAGVLAAQGELPRLPDAAAGFMVIELRSTNGEVGTLEVAADGATQFSVGRPVDLADLALQGLKATSEKTLSGRSLNCPSCGAAVTPKLEGTLSLSCGQCHAVIDLSRGAAGELAHHTQSARRPGGRQPQVPLGAVGRLAADGATALEWQCVGYVERCDLPEETGDAQTCWSEYLLYNRTAGFAFLVDAQDGWSLVRPLSGAPQLAGAHARWQGGFYEGAEAYTARVNWVEGEFYWRLQRDERAKVTDFVGTGKAAGKLLSREQTGNEVTWSGGRRLDAAEVAKAFNVPLARRPAFGADIRPTAAGSGGVSFKGWLILFLVLTVVLVLMSRCGDSACDGVARAFGANSAEHRQCLQSRSTGTVRGGGGSFGGYSSGGGHK